MVFPSPAPIASLKDSHPHIDDLSTVLASNPSFSQSKTLPLLRSATSATSAQSRPQIQSLQRRCSLSGSLVFLLQSPRSPSLPTSRPDQTLSVVSTPPCCWGSSGNQAVWIRSKFLWCNFRRILSAAWSASHHLHLASSCTC